MHGLLENSETLRPVQEALAAHLLHVQAIFDRQLESDLPPVSRLCRHVERYRGKMLRPSLVLASGLAAHPAAAGPLDRLLTENHAKVGAVCELVHMATLVHDDVLDEADTRRRGQTVNRLYGNEAAVILGDYLIASAYHLCSQVDSATALAIGRASTVMCTGELLQLHHRDDFSLDEPTYFEIVERKTAALIAAACDLGARHSGASEETCGALDRFGRAVGVAFQIQDDLLDLSGDERVVGKSLGKDLEKGKLTLPLIHHLRTADPETRGRTLRRLEVACNDDPHTSGGAHDAATSLHHALDRTGSIAYSAAKARALVQEGKAALAALPDSPPKALMLAMADAVVNRAF